MTPAQKKKWIKSAEFAKAEDLRYPYGFNEANDDEWEKIMILCAKCYELEKAFRGAQDAARDKWTESTLEECIDTLCAYDSAYSNAVDTHREGRFDMDSISFWSCATTGARMFLESTK